MGYNPCSILGKHTNTIDLLALHDQDEMVDSGRNVVGEIQEIKGIHSMMNDDGFVEEVEDVVGVGLWCSAPTTSLTRCSVFTWTPLGNPDPDRPSSKLRK